MPTLTLHRRQMFKLSIPYWVFLNEQPICIMQGKEVSIELPPAQFDAIRAVRKNIFRTQSGLKILDDMFNICLLYTSDAADDINNG